MAGMSLGDGKRETGGCRTPVDTVYMFCNVSFFRVSVCLCVSVGWGKAGGEGLRRGGVTS